MANRKTRRSASWKTDREKQHILNQMHMDAFQITVNELFHVGAGRMEECCVTYMKAINEISGAVVEDFELAQHRIDERLRKIVPEDKFLPWQERYRYDR